MEIRRRTPAEVREHLEGSADLIQLIPDAAEREAFVEQTVAAAEHHYTRERVPLPPLERLDPAALQCLPEPFPWHLVEPHRDSR